LMTGWAGPGTNLPVSSVTVGSLWDMGYTVNMATANSYTPSSSAVATARSASGSGISSILAIAESGAAVTVEDMEESGMPRRVAMNSLNNLPTRFASRPDFSLLDTVVADSTRRGAQSIDLFLHRSDEGGELDVAWEQFGLDWDLRPACVGV
jgi:hypothetical protein